MDKDALMKKASAMLGIDTKTLSGIVAKGDISALKSHMKENDAKRLDELIKNKDAVQKAKNAMNGK